MNQFRILDNSDRAIIPHEDTVANCELEFTQELKGRMHKITKHCFDSTYGCASRGSMGMSNINCHKVYARC